MSGADWTVLCAVGILVILAVFFAVRRKKSGRSCCGGCDACRRKNCGRSSK